PPASTPSPWHCTTAWIIPSTVITGGTTPCASRSRAYGGHNSAGSAISTRCLKNCRYQTMFVRNNPDIDYDILEVEVRQRMAELERLRQDQEAGGRDTGESFEVGSLAELYALDDEDFIQAAYHSFLGRDADPEGFAHYLSLLQEGVSKSAVAAGLRYSRAGRARPQRFRLRKAWLSWIATRTPVVGGLLESLLALLGVAGLKRNLLQLQRQVALQSREMNALQRALM